MEHFAIFEMLPEGRENAISRRTTCKSNIHQC